MVEADWNGTVSVEWKWPAVKPEEWSKLRSRIYINCENQTEDPTFKI
jgi:hypothetical protein